MKPLVKHSLLLLSTDLRRHFETPPYSERVARGQQVELRCLPPKGKPKPSIYWLRYDNKRSQKVRVGSARFIFFFISGMVNESTLTLIGITW